MKTSRYRVEFWGSQIEAIRKIDPVTGDFDSAAGNLRALPIYPEVALRDACANSASAPFRSIHEELDWWKGELDKQGKIVEAQRIVQRTHFDHRDDAHDRVLPRHRELFAAHVRPSARRSAAHAARLFPADYLLFIDESHQTVPQLHAMYPGDRSRKQTLVNYGFRMPSALDNRPLNFEEFEHRTNQVVYVSATPGPYELTKVGGVVVEQVIRPTGLVDPEVEVRPVKGQVDDLLEEIRIRAERNERVLVTTLTKRMAEDLAEYFARGRHSRAAICTREIDTLERVEILRDLRRGEFDVLIGINLLARGTRSCRKFRWSPSSTRIRKAICAARLR